VTARTEGVEAPTAASEATVERVVEAPPEAVAAVLADARRYDSVVVGSKRIRWFDARWPEPGTRFHHSVGFGPLHIRDHTTVMQDALPDRLRLRAGMGPLGAAEVDFTLTPSGGDTRVAMREEPVSGPLKALWSRPLAAAMRARNARSLRRLEKLAQDRARLRAADPAAVQP
jgi:carbon monoxide dehydrogenase subunit G